MVTQTGSRQRGMSSSMSGIQRLPTGRALTGSPTTVRFGGLMTGRTGYLVTGNGGRGLPLSQTAARVQREAGVERALTLKKS